MLIQKVGGWGDWLETINASILPRLVKTAAVQSTITENAKTGMKFLNLFGDTFPIKDQLKGLGFRYFKGIWGMPVEMAKGKADQIAALGIDTSILTSPQAAAGAPAVPAAQQPPLAAGTPEQAPQTPTQQTLAQMKAAMDEALKTAPADKKTQTMFQFIDEQLDKFANSVDEAGKQAFIKDFLAFASRFHEYSFGNQMLIWFQRPDATYVSGFKQWMEKGRQVVKWDRPITIIRPQVNRKPYNDAERAAMPPDQQGKMRQWTSFKPASVYDISDTQTIPGWKGKEGNGPFEPMPLKTAPNEQEEQITQLVQAGKNFSQALGISVDLEKELREDLGGYSAGKEIAVNKMYAGINQFAVLAHEMAHEVLHRQEDQKTPVRNESRQSKEIDAETVAYIVLKHYGYESKDAPNYIALWKGTGELVRARRNNISKAVKIIVDGIDKEMGNVIKFEDAEAPEAAAPEAAPIAPTASSWVRANCKFALDMSGPEEDDLLADKPLKPNDERSELLPLVNKLPSDMKTVLRPAIQKPEVDVLHKTLVDLKNPSDMSKLKDTLTKTPLSKNQLEFKNPKNGPKIPPPMQKSLTGPASQPGKP